MTRRAGRFAVVIVAHREYATLELCLRGFQPLVDEPADLIFVDNGSGGLLSEQIASLVPGATVVTLKENRVFCGGYNAGIRIAMDSNYDYVLLVNADTEVVNPDFIGSLIGVMERHPRAAFIGPLVFYRNLQNVQTTCLSFPNIWHNILVWLPFRLFPRLVSRQSRNEQEVEFLNGVCVLCRIRALREIGLLDESFGAYVEDADWAWRADAIGWRSFFAPVPSIIHHEERHGYEHHSIKSFLLKRNTVHWFIKAGKLGSARAYAAVSVILARLRSLIALNQHEREAHRAFASRLKVAYSELLSGATDGPTYVSHLTPKP